MSIDSKINLRIPDSNSQKYTPDGLNYDYFFRGIKFTEKQLKFIIGVSEKFFVFKLAPFLRFSMYHGVMYLISPFLMVPIIFTIEGFNPKIIGNLQFVRLNPICFANTCMTCVSTYSLYRNYQWYTDPEAEFDVTFLLQFLMTILLRSVVVGSKYGLFSEERISFFRELNLSQEILSFDLTFSKVNDTEVRNHLTAIEDIMEEMKIDDEFFKFTIYKNQEKYGLRNTGPILERMQSEEAMIKYYSIPEDERPKPPIPEKIEW